MEHNEYAVWRVKMRLRRSVREPHEDYSRVVGSKVSVEEFVMVAPKGDLGKALINVHLTTHSSWKFGDLHELDNGQKFEILEMREETLHTVIRYDDQYRGRM
jgi:hypothetical protein